MSQKKNFSWNKRNGKENIRMIASYKKFLWENTISQLVSIDIFHFH